MIPAQPLAPFERRKINVWNSKHTTSQVVATCLGNWAYHPMPESFGRFNHFHVSITHIPSGRSISPYLTAPNAVSTIALVRDFIMLLHENYNLTYEELQANTEVKKTIIAHLNKLGAHIEKLCAVLGDKWELFEDFAEVQNASE